MIEFRDVSFAYDDHGPVLAGADFVLDEGELALVVGPTGSGKSTLLRCVNGLVPHFSGGTLHGRVVVDGRDTRTHRPRDLVYLPVFMLINVFALMPIRVVGFVRMGHNAGWGTRSNAYRGGSGRNPRTLIPYLLGMAMLAGAVLISV